MQQFWADDWEMDLLRVLDEQALCSAIASVSELNLYTHGIKKYDRLGHPNVWNTHRGITAFFGMEMQGFKPNKYVTDDSVVECTFLELLRDWWGHSYTVCLYNRYILTPPRLTDFQILTTNMRQPVDEVIVQAATDSLMQKVISAVETTTRIQELLASRLFASKM